MKNLKLSKSELLYQHKHQIIALEIECGEKITKNDLIEEKDIMLDVNEEKKFPNDREKIADDLNSKYIDALRIISIDTFENLYIYKDSKLIGSQNLRE